MGILPTQRTVTSRHHSLQSALNRRDQSILSSSTASSVPHLCPPMSEGSSPEDMSKDSPREDVEEKSHRDGSATQNKFTEAPSRTHRRSRSSGSSKASDARQTHEQDAAGENCSVPREYAAIIGAGSSAQLLDLEHQQATLHIPIAPISQTEAGPESTLSTWLSIEVDDSDGEMQTEAGPESILTSLSTWLSIEVDDSDGEMDES